MLRVTRHGPVITDLIPGETRKGRSEMDLVRFLYRSLLRLEFGAKIGHKFLQAAGVVAFAGGRNMMYADVDGHIGYQATGAISHSEGGRNGSLPVPGNDDGTRVDRVGSILKKLPSVLDPPSGVSSDCQWAHCS